jgi:hypothetical protein
LDITKSRDVDIFRLRMALLIKDDHITLKNGFTTAFLILEAGFLPEKKLGYRVDPTKNLYFFFFLIGVYDPQAFFAPQNAQICPCLNIFKYHYKKSWKSSFTTKVYFKI